MRFPRFTLPVAVFCVLAVLTTPYGAFATSGPAGYGVNLLRDPGFEAEARHSPWQGYSLNAGTPLCDGTCNSHIGSGPRSGARWVWFGGAFQETELAGIEQRIGIPHGATATLGITLEIPAATCAGYLAVYIDDTLVFQATEADHAAYAQYTWIPIDVSDFADGGTHHLYFECSTAPRGHLSFFVDDVSLVVMAPTKTVLDHLVADFAAHDADSDGFLSAAEAADDWYNIQASGFANWDSNGDHQITLPELQAQLALLDGKQGVACAAGDFPGSGPGASEIALFLLLVLALGIAAARRPVESRLQFS